MKSVSKEDHPDFVGGVSWSRLELDWIRARDAKWEGIVSEQKGTIRALNIALGGEGSTSSENLIDAGVIDLDGVGLISLCRKMGGADPAATSGVPIAGEISTPEPEAERLEAVAWLSTDCIGERYLCFSKPTDADPVYQLVRHSDAARLIGKLEARIAELESEASAANARAESLARGVMADHVMDDSHGLFITAIRDIAAINVRLGCDPDDGGAVPIIEAIDELKRMIADQASKGQRLALELECLLLDIKDNAIVSKWWYSAWDAIEDWRKV